MCYDENPPPIVPPTSDYIPWVEDQILLLSNDLFQGFVRDGGDKRTTIRKGRRDIKLEGLTFLSTEPVNGAESDWYLAACPTGFLVDGKCHPNNDNLVYLAQTVDVKAVTYIRVYDMTDLDAQADGFNTVEDLFEGMRRYYPDLDWEDELTIIEFELQTDFFENAVDDIA